MTFQALENRFDKEQAAKDIVAFIRRIVHDARAKGVVVGLSSGVDSNLTVTLCTMAFGKETRRRCTFTHRIYIHTCH